MGQQFHQLLIRRPLHVLESLRSPALWCIFEAVLRILSTCIVYSNFCILLRIYHMRAYVLSGGLGSCIYICSWQIYLYNAFLPREMCITSIIGMQQASALPSIALLGFSVVPGHCAKEQSAAYARDRQGVLSKYQSSTRLTCSSSRGFQAGVTKQVQQVVQVRFCGLGTAQVVASACSPLGSGCCCAWRLEGICRRSRGCRRV